MAARAHSIPVSARQGSLIVPCGAVFIASFCVMVLELVAGRLIARHLGSSLYTWTAIIGIVLAGISIGNYLGGRLADRYAPGKTLAALFVFAAGFCCLTLPLNAAAGQWRLLWSMSWPARVFLHVGMVFFVPSVLLGAITPVIAKWALDLGLATGRTVGDIYAWNAAGSIAGTFAAGFYLIAVLTTTSIIWIIAAILVLLALTSILLMRGSGYSAAADSVTAAENKPVASSSAWALVGPCATVFISNCAILILELVASRIMSRHLGATLYTWTSVIGVVLAGITIGNYAGGRIADRFCSKKTIALLFCIISAAFVITVLANNLVAEWTWLWQFSWPLRTFLHVTIVFLLPSLLLGTISPVVAKAALDRGLATGRTVGNIYAWGAAGCIVGTFAAGYFLIASLGTLPVIWMLAGAMLCMALIYKPDFGPAYAWLLIFTAALIFAAAPWPWTKAAGEKLALRTIPDSNVIYEDESQYNYIAVKRVSQNPEIRAFLQDKLVHSRINMYNITDLRYSYEPVYAAVTHRFSKNKEILSTLTIGGGGYAFPRYIEAMWPGSRIDVVEIDPAVTEAAMSAFGLSRSTSIRTITMDGRNYIDELIEKQKMGAETLAYDFIYEDAINDYSVPFQLVTRQFNERVTRVLKPGGIYMVNLIDVYDSGLFLGAVINTLKQTFSNVYVLSEPDIPRDTRCTFVIVAANRRLDMKGVGSEYRKSLQLWQLSKAQIAALRAKADGLILTDDYAPVENLLIPVVHKNVEFALSLKAEERARHLAEKMQRYAWQGDAEAALQKLYEVLAVDPSKSVDAFLVVGGILKKTGASEKALSVYEKGIVYNKQNMPGAHTAGLHYNLAGLLVEAGKPQKAFSHMRKAEAGYRNMLKNNPRSVEAHAHLGDIALQFGYADHAEKHFRHAVALNPAQVRYHIRLADALAAQERFRDAIALMKNSIRVMKKLNMQQNVSQLQERLAQLFAENVQNQQ